MLSARKYIRGVAGLSTAVPKRSRIGIFTLAGRLVRVAQRQMHLASLIAGLGRLALIV